MAPTELIPSFDARLSMHRIDNETRKILAETWPLLELHLEQAIDDVLIALQDLPRIGKIVAEHTETLKTLEAAHFRALLGEIWTIAMPNRAGAQSRRKPRWGSTHGSAAHPAASSKG